MSQHTPRPWKVCNDETPWTEGDAELAIEYGEAFGITDVLFSITGGEEGGESVVARLPWEPGADSERQGELRANARLIAAAPELRKVVAGGVSAISIFEAEFADTEVAAWLKDARALLATIDGGTEE